MTGSRSYDDPCSVARSLDVIGERWALLVVRELLFGPKRFNDLLAGLTGASPNVVSQRLRELIGHGVIHRRDLGPPSNVRVYELTDWGRELEPVLFQLGQWGSRAPLPPDGRQSLDSLMLSVKAVGNSVGTVERGRYQVRVDADVFTLEAVPGSVEVRRGTTDHPDATLTTDGETLRAVCGGQRSLTHAVRSGEVRLDGDEAAANDLTDLLLAPFSSA